MSYFDSLTAAYFKKNASGRTLYYPWGTLGSGYELASEEQDRALRNSLKVQLLVLLAVIVGVQIVLGEILGLLVAFLINLSLALLYAVYHNLSTRALTRNLVRSPEPLTVAESFRNSARSHGWTYLILLELVSLAFTMIGVLLATRERGSLEAYAVVAFFGLGSVALGYMIIAKARGSGG